ncbi:hypothetical protein [Microbacterium sp. CCH5-D1]|jgi:hypothetical protein|uniref:hypothetical protein n=1 Tax=Microbacterium sp. CCH5-D1 TaxID=1768780 RepID=UPI00076A5694|nr:hypothetical protein [Microbacterium sp. CCH5-D1]
MTEAAGGRLDFSAWSTRLYVWGDKARRFNNTRLSIVAIVGGIAGLALSIVAGTAMTWLLFGIAITAVFLAMLIVSGNGGRLHTITPLQWVALALAPFFNQIAFVAAEFYVFAVAGIVTGLLLPLTLHGLAWLFWRLSPAMP